MPGFFTNVDTEELDSACESLFGHTDWEFVEDKDTHITIKFNVEDTREEEEQFIIMVMYCFGGGVCCAW